MDSIAFSGTIGQAEQTFHTQIVWFKGTGSYANKTDARIPFRFKGIIGSIVGLYNFPSPQLRIMR
jgi:subtilase family serine protease